jgi:hypothetical protein
MAWTCGRDSVSQCPGRLDEAVVPITDSGINRPDYVPAEGVAIVELQRNVTVYAPSDLAVRQSGQAAILIPR